MEKMDIDKNGIISLSNGLATCEISLFGANIVSYHPKNQEQDIFWLGDLNKFDNVQAIRGGVPVCWPRFAEEKLNGGLPRHGFARLSKSELADKTEEFRLPRHGFARLSKWTVKNVFVDETKMEVELSLIPDKKFNVDVTATLFIKITDKLEYQLETTNNGDEIFEFSEALHAYFNIGSIDDVKIKGLTNHQYKNSLDGKYYTLGEDLKIKGEFDSAFQSHKATVEIVDNVLNRIISIEKSGSNTTIVWNPNKDLAEMSEGQYKKFVCVEPANQGDFFVRLHPKQKHRISMIVQVKNLK